MSVTIFSCSVTGFSFFFKNSSLCFAFLLRVDRLTLFLAVEARVSLHLVSRVKEKADPIERENWNILPWLDNAWQNAMHYVAREESSSPAIFSYF